MQEGESENAETQKLSANLCQTTVTQGSYSTIPNLLPSDLASGRDLMDTPTTIPQILNNCPSSHGG